MLIKAFLSGNSMKTLRATFDELGPKGIPDVLPELRIGSMNIAKRDAELTVAGLGSDDEPYETDGVPEAASSKASGE